MVPRSATKRPAKRTFVYSLHKAPGALRAAGVLFVRQGATRPLHPRQVGGLRAPRLDHPCGTPGGHPPAPPFATGKEEALSFPVAQ